MSQPPQFEIEVLDVSRLSYSERISAAALQGLVDRRKAVFCSRIPPFPKGWCATPPWI